MGSRSKRLGLSLPLTGIPLAEHEQIVRALPGLGFTDAWSSESNAADAFTPLALAAAWQPGLRLGTAIVPVFTRGPAVLAMSAAALADAAPGRVAIGIGASSPVIVGDWNGLGYERPYQRCADTLAFLRQALDGGRVDADYETFAVRRFRLARPPATPPRLLLAALRPRMLRLAGTHADGVILNLLAAADVARCIAATGNPDIEVVARILVCPTEDAGHARELGRRILAGYLGVRAYAAFHDWLGRREALTPTYELLAAREWAAARAAIPDEVVDALVIHGSPGSCGAQLAEFADAGVHTPVVELLPTGAPTDTVALLREIALAAGGRAAATR